jgi:hypothetical protein
MATPKKSSATAIVFPAGALMTAIPSSVATSIATLSTPTPARPTTRSRSARRSSSAEIFVALRPTMASYCPMRSSSVGAGRVGTSSTRSAGSASSSATPSRSTSSVTRTR